MSSPELFVVATPIGNLKDITLRALDVLREVDFVICEDTRRCGRLLNHYGIKKPLLSYYAPKEREKAGRIIGEILKGKKAALLTDAGTPLVSDPGAVLIKRAVEERIKIVPIPGPSSLTTALSISALACGRFAFWGFAKRKGKRELEKLKEFPGCLVFFERASRVGKFMKRALEVFGDRECEIHRELTKVHEEVLRGRVSRFLDWEGKGEVVIIISPL